MTDWPFWLWWLAVFAAALVEHVFPPFPGDSLVVLGAASVAGSGGSPGPVLFAATLGAVLGAGLDWWVGRRGRGAVERLSARNQGRVRRLVEAFQRHGAVLLAVNRFIPGVRALFFVAAGVAELPLGPVLFWSTVSSVLWNIVLVGLGTWLAWQIEPMLHVLSRVGLVVWGGLVVGGLVLWWRSRTVR